MIVYHGGYCEINLPKIIQGKYAKDFGQGFYCTIIKEQAEKWARRYSTPVVSSYNFQTKNDEQLIILEFKKMTEEWLDFIVSCRNGNIHEYDIVIGAMANDQIYNYIADYINGVITRKQFWVLAEFKHPTHQINFCTPNALSCLKFEKSEIVL